MKSYNFYLLLALSVFGSVYANLIAVDISKVKTFVEKNGFAKDQSSVPYTTRISMGEAKLNSILKGGTQAVKRQEYINAIVNVLWYLYAVAVTKDQGFISGTMVIQDPDNKLYNFFFNYVKSVNPDGLKKAVSASTNPYAYARISTHFNEAQKKGNMQYGIDIRLKDKEKAQPILPNNATHLLFGRLGNGFMFVKMESHGLYIKDGFVGHAGGLLKSIGRKIKAKLTGGKSEDTTLARREALPQKIKNEYQKICKENKLTCKTKTIKGIIKQSAQNGELVPLVSKIAGIYDHPTFRYGNEVILMQSELK